MPWENYAEMTDADVRSLYRYLPHRWRRSAPIGPSHGPSHRRGTVVEAAQAL